MLITRVPLMIVWSHRDVFRVGGSLAWPVSSRWTWGPRFWNWAGVDGSCQSLEGRFDEMGLLDGTRRARREITSTPNRLEIGILTGCRFHDDGPQSNAWKLVHFLDEPWGQLFDLSADPDEVRNLWDDPAANDKKAELLAVLREWRIRSDCITRDWSRQWR